MERRFFVPASTDLRVLDPVTHRPLPPGGAWVEVPTSGAIGSHWLRRLAEGDIRDQTPADAPASATPDPANQLQQNASRTRTPRVRNT